MRPTPSNPYATGDAWSGPTAARWLACEAALDRVLEPFGAAALITAGLCPGERALDVGCGTGATTVAIARAVGPRGHVLGLDISAPLLRRARQRAVGQKHIRFIDADAQTATLSRDRDLVFSRFGMMFFSDPLAAFVNLAGALHPGGSLTFVCWRSFRDNPWQQLAFETTRKLLPDAPGPPSCGPGPYSLADRSLLVPLLDAAGFRDPHIRRLDHPVRLGASLSEAVQFATNTGPTGRALASRDIDTRQQVEEAIATSLTRHLGAGGVVLAASAWLVTAFAP
jgi:SAM-dependent methyltransferase